MRTVGMEAKKEEKKTAEEAELKKELKAAKTENTKLKKANEELRKANEELDHRIEELEAENKKLLEGEPEEGAIDNPGE